MCPCDRDAILKWVFHLLYFISFKCTGCTQELNCAIPIPLSSSCPELSLPAASVAGSAWHKLGILARLGRLQEHEGLSLRTATLRLSVEKSTLSDWKKLLSAGTPLLHGMQKKSAHDGPLGQFAPIEDDLL